MSIDWSPSPGHFIRAVGRDFPNVADAENHAREYMRTEGDVLRCVIFLVSPGCVPARLWDVERRPSPLQRTALFCLASNHADPRSLVW